MTSEQQIQANKENAQHSTGPNNTEKTKFNATKHCLTSKKLFELNYREEIERNYQMHSEFLNPENIIEENMVKDLAILRTRIDIANMNVLDTFEYNPPKIKKSKKILDKKWEEFQQSTDMNYNMLNPEEQEEYERLKEEEEKEEDIDTSSNRLTEGTELFTRYEAEARSQYYKLLRQFQEMRKWLRFGK